MAGFGSLHERIIDAVDALTRSHGWSATTMSDVARATGVSRQSVYNEFGSRPELVKAYVLREVSALITAAEEAVRRRRDDPREALRAAFGEFLKLASDEPLVRVIVADADGGELIRELTGLGRAAAIDRIGAVIVELWPQVRVADAELIAESMARLAISHALLPNVVEAATTADLVTRMLGPFIDEIIDPQ